MPQAPMGDVFDVFSLFPLLQYFHPPWGLAAVICYEYNKAGFDGYKYIDSTNHH